MTFAEPPTRRLERANPIPGQAPDAIGDTAGDPPCGLDKVCPACGLLTGADEPACPRCGEAMPV